MNHRCCPRQRLLHPAGRHRPRGRSGWHATCRGRHFTLAECLAALAFTAIVLPIAVQAVMVTARSSERARRTDIAGRLAANLLYELTVTGDWRTSEEQGDFGESHPGYAWELNVEDWDQDERLATSMTLITVRVTYAVQGHTMATDVSVLEAGSE